MTADSGTRIPPGTAQLVSVLPIHRFDEVALARHLRDRLPGFNGPVTIRQFQGGQSNPTYLMQTQCGNYVLRKRPVGRLLPSAHAVDREFAVQHALEDSGVPVARMRYLCTDESVIGQAFYVMDHVVGRVFTDRLLPGCLPPERAAMYDDMNRVLVLLHSLDHEALGLGRFGRSGGYATRQIERWSRQYRESRVHEVPAMERLLEWLPRHVPVSDESAINHGDYRIGNLIFHPTEPRVAAVLDWELATIGHPLADLAYNCLAYRLPYLSGRGFGDADISALGIPREVDYLRRYCERTGRASLPDWDFFIVLSLFRTAAIQVGVHRRALDGNAADSLAVGSDTYTTIAAIAWETAKRIGPP
jgi:aminoglycoside phosphotransferase (APT) family kinase protein